MLLKMISPIVILKGFKVLVYKLPINCINEISITMPVAIVDSKVAQN